MEYGVDKPENQRHEEEQHDANAMRRLFDGDESGFDEIVRRYTPQIFSLSYRMLGSSEAAEDAVQEIFTKVYRAAGQYDFNKRFFPWLYTIALNYLRSQLRSKKTRMHTRALEFDEELSAPGSRDELPEDRTMRREVEEQLQQTLQQLKPAYREVFLLRQMEELSVKETARVLDIPENTVKTNFRRARTELRNILARRGWQ